MQAIIGPGSELIGREIASVDFLAKKSNLAPIPIHRVEVPRASAEVLPHRA